MRYLILVCLVAAGLGGAPTPSRACDLCAIYSATHLRESRIGFHLGLAEQYSSNGTLQQSGHEIDNPAGEYLHSFITQVIAGYTFTPRLGVQLNVPLIARTFRRQEASGIVTSDESGFGDLSLIGTLLAYSNVTEQSIVRWTLLGGLKLPSGNSRRLKEELAEPQGGATAPHPALVAFHLEEDPEGTESESGIHGHDLALGSGSVDGVLGTQAFVTWQRLFASAAVQYLLRTEGDFGYHYANDLIFSGGPGGYLWLSHDLSLGLQAILAGESKGNDHLNDVRATDTGITALYVGPGLTFTWGTSVGMDLAADLPVVQNNSAVQIVPDFRIRGGLTWRF